MQFKVLGPLRVFTNNGQEIPIPGRIKVRLVSTLLYAHFQGGDAVRTHLLTDAAWGDGRGRSQESLLARLRQELTQLRKLFAPEERIPRIQAGLCRFELTSRDQIDAIEFQIAVEAAREALERGDERSERMSLQDAARMWADRPFVDIEEHLFGAEDGIALLNRDYEYLVDRLRLLGRSKDHHGRPKKASGARGNVDSRPHSIQSVDSVFSPDGPDINVRFLASASAPTEMLVGREQELEELTEAWNRPGQHLVGIVGVGGIGKTHLLNYWTSMMAAEASWRDTSVFGYTFKPHRESGEQGDHALLGIEADINHFFDEALRFAGQEDLEIVDDKERGLRLARLLQRRKTLLLLDGLEAIQSPRAGLGPGQGRLLERTMAELLRALAIENPGLCVATSRVQIPEISGVGPTSVLRLEGLSGGDGSRLLASLASVTPDTQSKERLALVLKSGGHPLTLSVLGNYIRVVCGGDFRGASEIEIDSADELHGGLLSAVLERYDIWLGPGPERSLLRLMGFFQSTATSSELEILRSDLIPEFADDFVGLFGDQWPVAAENLRNYGLLAKANPDRPDDLTAHPLVHHQMARRLKNEAERAWTRGHECLYRHHAGPKDCAANENIDLQALMLAVQHGSIAGQYSEVFEEIIWKKLSVGFDYRPGFQDGQNVFRLLGADLNIEVVQYFFGKNWDTPQPGLSLKQRCRALNWAGTALRMAGRLDDAEVAHKTGWNLCIDVLAQRASEPQDQDDIDWWECIGAHGCYYGRLLIVRGRVAQGYEYTKAAYERARQIDFPSFDRAACNVHAGSLHWLGRLEEAEALFKEGEAVDLKGDQRLRTVLLVQVFQRNELRIDRADYEPVLRDLMPMLEGSNDLRLPDPIPGLARLLVSESLLTQIQPNNTAGLTETKSHIGDMLSCLRRFGLEDYLARALKLSATVARLEKDYSLAHTYAAEALDLSITTYRLIEAACWVEQARIYLAEGNVALAEEAGGHAKRCSSELELPLHAADCDLFSAELACARGEREIMSDHLVAAQEAVTSMGYRRRQVEIDYLNQKMQNMVDSANRPV